MRKPLLLTPGPTMIPPSVLQAMAMPILHHRTKDFEVLFADVREKLKWLFETQGEVISLACTGTGAMEAAVVNLCSPGDAVVTINLGKFGERFTKITQNYGLQVEEIFVERGKTLELSVLEQKLKSRKVHAVFFQASETSTGTATPVQQIAALAKKYGALSICDAITACGVFSLPMDAWGIDVLMTASQKALMLPPGLALIALSDQAWAAQAKAKLPKFYFDLAGEKKAHLKNQTAWTPAISIIVGAQVSLGMMMAEGREVMFARHERLAHATRVAVQAMGLKLFSEAPSTAVTTVCVPEEIADGKQIIKRLRERFAVIIAGGQDELEGKIFRLSHFGYCNEADIIIAINKLEIVLKELGYGPQFGAGGRALLELFSASA
jgi:aspartate aminotransferase-like enzyme